MRPGEIRRAEITEAHDYDLVAGIIDEPEKGWRGPNRPLFPILSSHTSLPISRGQ